MSAGLGLCLAAESFDLKNDWLKAAAENTFFGKMYTGEESSERHIRFLLRGKESYTRTKT